jgi:Flp pilus assembly pilin Flp
MIVTPFAKLPSSCARGQGTLQPQIVFLQYWNAAAKPGKRSSHLSNLRILPLCLPPIPYFLLTSSYCPLFLFQYLGAIGSLMVSRYDQIVNGLQAFLPWGGTKEVDVMKQLWERLWDEERGQNVSEYTLVLVLVGLLGASVASAFGVTVHGTYSTLFAAIPNQSPSVSSASNSASNAGVSPASSSSSSSSDGSDSGSDSGSGNGKGNGNGNGYGKGKGNGLALGHK